MQFSVSDVAQMLAVAESQVYQWINEEGLPAEKVGSRFRVNRSELLEWATARRIDVYGAAHAGSPPTTSDSRLVDSLRAGGIFHAIDGADKAAVLRSVAL